MVFLPQGNYVDMCKRYRRYAIDSRALRLFQGQDRGSARSYRTSSDGRLVGMRVLRNVKPGSADYDPKDPSKNYRLVTFEQNTQQLREVEGARL